MDFLSDHAAIYAIGFLIFLLFVIVINEWIYRGGGYQPNKSDLDDSNPPQDTGGIKEGPMYKGGWNNKPTTKRPAPPKGQRNGLYPKNHKGWAHLKG